MKTRVLLLGIILVVVALLNTSYWFYRPSMPKEWLQVRPGMTYSEINCIVRSPFGYARGKCYAEKTYRILGLRYTTPCVRRSRWVVLFGFEQDNVVAGHVDCAYVYFDDSDFPSLHEASWLFGKRGLRIGRDTGETLLCKVVEDANTHP